MLGILSYGLGNINAIKNMLDDLNIESKMISNPNDINTKINKIILPGVGSFDYAMELLENKNFIKPILDFTSFQKNKLLGICVGMQILASNSEEGNKLGLNLIPGNVKKFKKIKILPHVGWNAVANSRENKLLGARQDNSKFYFLHSYYFEPREQKYQIGSTNYFEYFASMVNNENIYGVQFHPEKSHDAGKIIFKNFANL